MRFQHFEDKTMKTYIGTKIIQAEPRAKDYGPAEQQGEAGYTVVYPDGYTSWSPAAAFKEAYRETSGMPFGLAIEALKKGKKVARAGWNGKGMFIYYVPANAYPAQTGAAKSHFGDGSLVPYNAYIAIKNVNETVSTWAPTINDALADDWQVVE
jgi:hypothetical protein